MAFNIKEYVDVADRIRQFTEKFPEGTLQGEGEFVRDDAGHILGYIYRAQAYRTPDDVRPGIGTAFEPIPGKTPYTRDSEVQNAETSAWGRVIVAVGFPTKHIASAQEVRNRRGEEPTKAAPPKVTPAEKPKPAVGIGTTDLKVIVAQLLGELQKKYPDAPNLEGMTWLDRMEKRSIEWFGKPVDELDDDDLRTLAGRLEQTTTMLRTQAKTV